VKKVPNTQKRSRSGSQRTANAYSDSRRTPSPVSSLSLCMEVSLPISTVTLPPAGILVAGTPLLLMDSFSVILMIVTSLIAKFSTATTIGSTSVSGTAERFKRPCMSSSMPSART
jgi:hypothetical protein